MDAVLRSRRVLLGAVLAGFALTTTLSACAGKSADAPVGTSTRRLATRDSPADAGTDSGPEVSPDLASFRTQMTKLTTSRVPSIGHASGRWDIDVYCNPMGCEALARGAAPKEGATFVVEHTERAATPVPGPVYFMVKMAPGYAPLRGDFRYVVVGARGTLVSDGPTAACADCHDEAPRERLFPFGVVGNGTSGAAAATKPQ